jgi:hypothetical protein
MTLIIIASAATAAGTTATAGTSATTTRTSTTAASWSSATTTARWAAPVSLGASFVDVQCASTQLLAIEGRDGFFCLGGIGHFDESKAARTASVAIGYDADLLDGPVGLKQRPQL